MKKYFKLILCLVVAYGLVGVMGCDATERSSKNDIAKVLLSLQSAPVDGSAQVDVLSSPENVAAQVSVAKRKRVAEEKAQYTAGEAGKKLKGKKGNIACKLCFETFTKQYSLNRHIKRQHTNERDFVCPYRLCGKTFVTNDALTTHRRVHTGVKPYICRYGCGRVSGTSTNRRLHEKIHEKEAALLAAAGKR